MIKCVPVAVPILLLVSPLGCTMSQTPSVNQKEIVWKRGADMNTSSAFHSVALLDDGRVLLVGGVSVHGDKRTYLTRTELYDPVKDRWATGNPLSTSRAAYLRVDPHALTVLSDGRVLLTGGDRVDPGDEKKFEPVLATEIFQPSSGQWTAGVALKYRRAGHAALRLDDGRIFVAGREKISELYDPKTNRWTETGEMPCQTYMGRGVVLKDGRVLMTGGYWDNKPWRECSLYDPKTNTWKATASMKNVRSWHMIAMLQDGRVLAAGGYVGNNKDTEGIEATRSAEIFDPKTETWSETGQLNEARYDTNFITLTDGRILAAGGATGALAPATATCEIYDPKTGTWTPTNTLSHTRRSHRTILLNDGKILITGGFTAWFKDTYGDCEIGTLQ